MLRCHWTALKWLSLNGLCKSGWVDSAWFLHLPTVETGWLCFSSVLWARSSSVQLQQRRRMAVPSSLFKDSFQVFVVMSMVVWRSVKQCLLSREQHFTLILPICVKPTLVVNKAGMPSWSPGCAGEIWEEGDIRCILKIGVRHPTEPSALSTVTLCFPSIRVILQPSHCKGALLQLSIWPFISANGGDSGRPLNTAWLFGCPSCK